MRDDYYSVIKTTNYKKHNYTFKTYCTPLVYLTKLKLKKYDYSKVQKAKLWIFV
jgi:hypothetical protein